ncbi:MAG: thiosulfate/3-mercaptopyruvate sulfurtransferase [Acidimicrobiia bacterium]|nr:thiosulfate/3-mercaptopyruvate sulfurtransferase [Acidimicrobiia bacterium]
MGTLRARYGPEPMEPIVSPDWLHAHLAEVVVADVRWYLDGRSGHDAYASGHLPGAAWIDLDSVLAAPPTIAGGRHPLPTPERFADGLRRAGIGDGALVVAYDDAAGMAAGRLVWLLRALGEQAALLDGGLEAWNGPLETGVVERPEATFTARPWPSDVFASADDVAAAVARGSLVLDARAAERYRGDTEPLDARAGHVPGALNAPFGGNLDPTTKRFLPTDQLRRRFASLGVTADREVVVYCGSGVSACHNLLALEAAGFHPARARLYPGSWSQWAGDPSRPVATGKEPE